MRLTRAAWKLLAASCSAALLASACGNSSNSGVSGSTGASNGTGAATSSGASKSGGGSSGIDGPDLGNLGGAAEDPGVTDPTDTCAGDLVEAKQIPLDMFVMLDVSASMLDPTEGDPNVNKWQAVSSALSDFISDAASAGLGMGLQVFPIPHPDAPTECTTNQQCGAFGPCFLKTCWNYPELVPCEANLDCGIYGPCVTFGECANDATYICNSVGNQCGAGLGACVAAPPSICLEPNDCRVPTYAAAAAEIGVLPGAEAGLLDVIGKIVPDGGTPTGPALTGAIQHASAWADAHPDHQVVTVLATDGLPTKCTPVDIADVAQIAESGHAATPSISTFVIGVFGPNDADAPANLHTIAESGGTSEAFIVDTQGNVAMQFRDALNQIRGSRLSCELQVPLAEAGRTVDFNQVNVEFDDGSGPQALFYVEDASGCDPMDGGWYYDKLPADGAPERIIVCPTTCDTFSQIDMGSVQIKLGCATRTPVK